MKSFSWLLVLGWAGCLAYMVPTSRPALAVLPMAAPPLPALALPADPQLRRDTTATVVVGRYTLALDQDGNPLAVGVRQPGDVEWWTYTVDYVLGEERRSFDEPPSE